VVSRSPFVTRLARGAAVLLASIGPAWAGLPLRYDVEIPDGESVTYSVELDVRDPGPVVIRAEGSSRRTIALRLEPPTGPARAVRRAGLPPLTLATTAEVDAGEIGTWRLELHAVAGMGSARLRVAIDLPEPPPKPGPSATRAAAPAARRPPTVRPEFDRLDAALPEHRPFLVAAARFAAPDRTPSAARGTDACRWQDDLVEYLAARASALGHGAYPARPTREILARIAKAIDAVEALRSTSDPLVRGPGPKDPSLERAWLRARAERLAPLEAELDELLSAIHRDHAPELGDEPWPARLVTCLTACERYFDERAVGARSPGNRDLAEAQWSRLATAAPALRELAALEPVSAARAD
jgi:hypothetical protein